MTPGKGNVRANYPKDKLEFKSFFSSPDGKQPGTQNKDFGTVWMMELTRSLVLSAVQGIRLLGAQNHSARTWVLCDHPFCTWQAKKI